MFRRSRITSLLGLVLWANLCVAQSPEPTPKSLADFDAIVTKAMADSKIPGLSVAIVRDGKVIYAKGYGYRDVEKTHFLRSARSRSPSHPSSSAL